MPVISDAVTATQRAQLGRIAEPVPSWKGKPAVPCHVCHAYYLRESLRRVHTPGAPTEPVCRQCRRAMIDGIGYSNPTKDQP